MAGLVTHVSLRDDVGNVVSFGPGDDVPAWAKAKITNPRVWEGGDDVDDDQTGGGGAGGGGGGDEPPPLAGAGSGRDVWAEYAQGKVEVAEDDKRDEIVAKLRAGGFRVE